MLPIAQRERPTDACDRLTPSDGSRWDLGFDLASAAVGAVVLLMIAMTFQDYGITWDETWHHNYGRHVIYWYASLVTDTQPLDCSVNEANEGLTYLARCYMSLVGDPQALTYRADYLYGGSFDGLGYLARHSLPFGRYESVHLFGALVACFGLLGAWKLGRLLGGPAAGFVTLTLLALTPVWYGHMFNNPKDMPFAVGYVWALYYECRILIAMPAVPKREWAKVSVALGIAMSVRIAGLLTLCYLIMLVGLYAIWRAREARDVRLIHRYVLRYAPKLAGVTLGAWALMLVFWPWAQLAPLRRPLIALARMSAFNLHERGMPFGAGRRISTLSPPADYLLRYFTFKLPEITVVLVVGALVAFIVRVVRVRRRTKHARGTLKSSKPVPPPAPPGERRSVAVASFLVFAILFPPLYTMAKRSPLYDGLRHFLFLVPMFTIVAGVTLTKLVRALTVRRGVAAIIGAWTLRAVFVGHCVRMVLLMAHLHPHQYLWFNAYIGQLPGAFERYSTDYYGNTYKEAFETLRTHLWETERERYLEGPYRVSACMPEFIAREYLGANFVLRRKSGPPADFWLGYTRNHCYKKHADGPELTRVERQGTLLVLIRDLRPTHEKKRKRTTTRGRPESKSKSKRTTVEPTALGPGINGPTKSKPNSKPKPKSKSKPKRKPKPDNEEATP